MLKNIFRKSHNKRVKKQKDYSKKLILSLLFLFLIITSLGYMFFNSKTAEAGWFDEAWNYRSAISITNSSGGALTDFQVSITVDTDGLYSDGKLQSDCDDLRFTSASGMLLPYWVEDSTSASDSVSCTSADSTVWVKVDSLPTTGADIYMYYGNPSATAFSSGKDTFNFFEDFSAASLDPIIWATATGSTSIANGEITITTGSIYTNAAVLDNAQNYVYEQRAQWTTTTGNQSGLIIGKDQTISSSNGGTDALAMLITGTGANYGVLGYGADGTVASYNIANGGTEYTATASTYHISGFSLDSTNLRFYNDRTQTNSYTGTWTNAPYVYVGNFQGAGAGTTDVKDMITDWVVVRKYASSVPSASIGSEEIGKGPFAWYKFDEGNGTTAYDSSSSTINGTINGATWRENSECTSGRCLMLDGTDDYIQMGDFYSDAFTICVWIKPAVTGQLKNIAIKRNSSGNTSSTNEWQFVVNTNDTITYSSWDGGGASTINLTSTQTIPTNVWSHVCAAQGGASATGYLYINAQQAASSIQGSAMIDSSTVIQIGSWSAGTSTRYFKGFIDEVKIYPYQRSAAEIRTDFLYKEADSGSAAQLGGDSVRDLSEGLVAYYPLNERTTDTCTGGANDSCDKSGNGNDLLWDTNDPTPAPLGKYGYGLDFETSSSEYAYTTDNTALSITGDLTLSAWVKFETVTNSGIISKDSGSSPTRGYYFSVQSSKLRFLLSGTGSNANYRDSSTTLTTGTWYHVAAVYDSKKGTQDIYVNGILDNGTYTGTVPSSIYDNNIDTRVGYAPSNGYFDGVIDEARIYNRALSALEIQNLYSFAPGPIAWWKFDDNTGTSSVDSSGNGYDLSSLNTNYWEPGKYGSSTSMTYGGSTSGWYLADNSAFEDLGAITIEAWVNRKNAVDHQRLVGKYRFSGSALGSWVLRFSSGNIPRFEVSSNGTSFSSVNGVTALSNDTWYHLAATYDGASMKLYVNGVLQATTSRTGNIYNSDYCVTVGYTAASTAGCATSTQNPFQGNMDDIRIYDYARTQGQVIADMAARGEVSSIGGLSPTVYWPFEYGSGSTAYDANGSSFVYNGTFGGATSPAWKNDGIIGKALDFTATTGTNGSRVSTSSPVNMGTATGSQLTVSMWVKPDASQTNSNAILVRNGTSTDANYYIYLNGLSGGLFNLGTGWYDGTSYAALLSTSKIVPVSTWTHIGVVITQGTDVKYYINGILTETKAWTGNNSVSATTSLNVGGHNGTTGQSYDGYIDEFKVYNYGLTASEIKLDYNLGKALVLGNSSTTSAGNVADNSSDRSYCVPGDTSTCSAPVAEWKLDENTGTSAYDSAGNSNTGTLTSGPTWESGKEGSAVGFDGNDDYVLVSDSSTLDVSTALSITTWVYVDDDSLEMDYVSKWMTGGLGSYFFGHSGSGDLVLALTGDGSTYNDYTATHTFNTGEWVFLAATWNTADDTAVIYQNGIPLTTTLSTGSSPASLYDSSTGVNIGARYEGGYANFDGKIDTTRIYNYVRTPAQIAWEYNQGNPVLWYKMDECQDSTLNDSGLLGENGTISVGGSGTHTSLGTCNTAGSVWGDGAIGKINASIDLDGTDEYVSITDNAALSPGTGDYTVATWFKTSKNYSATGWIFSNYGSTTANLVGLTVLSDENVSCLIRDGSSNSATFSGLGPSVSDGEWHHAACILNGNNAYLYVDGILRATVDATSVGTIDTTGRSKYIGTLGTTPGTQLFDGQIDDFRVYRYALNATQIKTLFNDGAVSFR